MLLFFVAMKKDRPIRERLRDVLFDLHEAQVPPKGAWRTWLFMGGRGAGKTRAGAEWVRAPTEIRSTPVSAMARTFLSRWSSLCCSSSLSGDQSVSS